MLPNRLGRLVLLALAAVLVLGVPGCTRKLERDLEDMRATSNYSEEDQIFLQVLHDNGFDASTDATAIENGHIVCENYEAGYTAEEILEGFSGPVGLSENDAAILIGAAIVYCPQYAQ